MILVLLFFVLGGTAVFSQCYTTLDTSGDAASLLFKLLWFLVDRGMKFFTGFHVAGVVFDGRGHVFVFCNLG